MKIHYISDTHLDFHVSEKLSHKASKQLKEILNYIFDNISNEQQLIVSVLGYDYERNEMNADNIIYLDNEKYELLNSTDYQVYKEILQKFNSTDNIQI